MRVRIALGLVAATVVAIGALDLHQHYRLGPAAAVGLSLLRAAPLAVVLRRPLPAWVGTVAAVGLTAAFARPVSSDEPWPWAVTSVLAALPVLAVLGARLSRPAQVAAWTSVPVAGAVPLLVAPDRGGWSALVPVAALAAAALVGGDLARGRSEARRRLSEQVVVTDAERERREVLQERARLARELHDVIAHGLSEVTVRADSAPHRLAGVSPAVAAEFDAIAEAARGALGELRQVLGVLRDPAAGVPTTPLPGLAALPALVGEAPLTVAVQPDRVPPVVQLTAYRIVQEALSNVRKHSPGATATVSLTGEACALRLTVVDSGGTTTPGIDAGRGYGLAGMRERVALLRGTLDAGPRPGGGWRVEAVLPLEQEDE